MTNPAQARRRAAPLQAPAPAPNVDPPIDLTRHVPVPRIFQVLIVIYVVLTGEIPRAIQALLFGLSGGGESAFTASLLLAVAVDIVRIAPLFILARHPLGILHPLIVAIVLWPLLVAMPGTIEEFGGLGGLFLGQPVAAPFYLGLGWRPGSEVWAATAFYNLLLLLSLFAAYAGFALTQGSARPRRVAERTFNPRDLRLLAIVLIAVSLTVLMVFISFRGGLNSHLADLSRGRFRSLAGLGPLVAIVDLGVISLILWILGRPGDAKSPLFLAALGAVSVAQFISNGSRSGTLLMLMVVGLAWALRTRRVPWKVAAIMAPLIFLSLGFLSVVRSAGWSGQTAGEAISSTDTAQVLSRVQEEIEIRRSVASAIPVTAEGFRVTDGPMLGRSYLAAVLAFIPRNMWEDKPRGPGSLYAQLFLGEVREGRAVPIGPVPEAYWNFGVLGVILIFFLYGLLLRRAHDLYMARASSPFVVCFFLIFVTTFNPTTDSLVVFQQQLLMLGIAYVLARLVTRSAEVVPGAPAPIRTQAPA